MVRKKDAFGLLSEKGLKITPQRVAVLEFLVGNPDHPSVDTVYREVKKRFPYISRATIYNTTKMFAESGLLKEILIQQEKTRVDWNVEPHHHFKCLKCGKVEDIPYRILTPKRAAKPLPGYEVRAVQVTMEGLCKSCV